MAVQVTFTFEPEPDERDESDRTGLTEAAFERLTERLMELGAEDITAEKAVG